MLHKLTSIPAILRLSLCLLVSAGLHGGVAYYDWADQPASVDDGQSAVVVALVVAADDPTFAVVDNHAPLEEQKPVVAEPKAMAKTIPNSSSQLAEETLRATSPKPSPMVEEIEVVDELAEECLPAEPVCAEPRETLSGPTEEVASIGTYSQETRVAQHDDSQPAHRTAARPTGEALIEAMPDYLNNPLPEYPYIARQRHWQGVVWLLVDVSALGLVDDVDVERSCGYRVLDRAASRTVKRWEFTPATRAGLPVESQVRIPVRFSLEDS